MFLTDTSEDIDAHFRYIASKKKSMFFSKWTPLGWVLLKFQILDSLKCGFLCAYKNSNF